MACFQSIRGKCFVGASSWPSATAASPARMRDRKNQKTPRSDASTRRDDRRERAEARAALAPLRRQAKQAEATLARLVAERASIGPGSPTPRCMRPAARAKSPPPTHGSPPSRRSWRRPSIFGSKQRRRWRRHPDARIVSRGCPDVDERSCAVHHCRRPHRKRRRTLRRPTPLRQFRGSRAAVRGVGVLRAVRSRWSASTQASIASPTGTARMPTHGS